MGKRKREDLNNCFKDSVDPRFCGIFSSSYNENTNNKIQDPLKITEDRYQTHDQGLQNFIYSKISQYFDKHMKEVDRPVEKDDFFKSTLENVSLFSDSDIITPQEVLKPVQMKLKRKKCKKEKSERELLKEVAVSFDWIQRQSEILKG